MVRHNAPFKQAISLPCKALERFCDNIGMLIPPQPTRSVALILVVCDFGGKLRRLLVVL